MFALALLVSCLIPTPQDSPGPEWGRRLQWAADGGPPAREHAAFIADPGRGRAVMLTGSGYAPYGNPLGDAWAFDFAKETWSELELVGDTIVPGGSRRAGLVDKGAFLHGGYTTGFAAVGELWWLELEDGRVVVEGVEQVNPPPARLLHAFACDAAGERFVVFGGGGQEGALGDTWLGRRTDEGVRWRQLETELDPGERFGFAFAHDVERGRLLVCGGQVPPDDGQNRMVASRDLWALDFAADEPAWTRLAEYDSDEFHGRRNPAFTFDQGTGDFFVWGGTGDGATALPDLYVVRTRVEGAPVERVIQPASISTRASGFGVVDRARDRALLGFGNTGQGPFDDLVEVRLRRPRTARAPGIK